LGRPEVDALLDRFAELGPEEIAASMPVEATPFTYAPVGGARARTQFMLDLRREVVALASELGYPGSREQRSLHAFDSDCAYLLHQQLGITPHEAGHREAWACLTTAHLLDVAVWRWDGITDRNRVNGDVNRDTFRRLWWRAEMLHDPAQQWDGFGGLGEDEIVAIMERPGVTGNPEVARAIVRVFRAQLDDAPALLPVRMHLMRDAMKRLTRLTPFLSLDVVGPSEIHVLIEALMQDAADAVAREQVALGSHD